MLAADATGGNPEACTHEARPGFDSPPLPGGQRAQPPLGLRPDEGGPLKMA